MNILFFQILAIVGLAAAIVGLTLRVRATNRRTLPVDRSPVKGDPNKGLAYAFTLGMMPWAKESTRIHAVAYVRGIGFHVGIFAGLGALLISPFWDLLPAFLRTVLAIGLGLGALLGAAGGVMRIAERHLRQISTADDHFAVWLVTAFLTVAALAVWNAAFVVPMYLVAALMLFYIPLGKIRHCIYFFFSRRFFGKFVGRRGVLPHPERIEVGGVK